MLGPRHARADVRVDELGPAELVGDAVGAGELLSKSLFRGNLEDRAHAAFFWGRLRQPGPALVISTRNFCMSHAPVGQRSAHRPQCRQTSSSFTMTRCVFNSPET